MLAGFHERASPLIVDVGACVVARPGLNALLEPLRASLAVILPDGAAADAIVNETDSGVDLLIRPHQPPRPVARTARRRWWRWLIARTWRG